MLSSDTVSSPESSDKPAVVGGDSTKATTRGTDADVLGVPTLQYQLRGFDLLRVTPTPTRQEKERVDSTAIE